MSKITLKAGTTDKDIAHAAATLPAVEHAIHIGTLNHEAAGRDAMDKARALTAELLGSHPTAMERLLVERIVACWWRTQQAEASYTHAHALASINQLPPFFQQVERAQRLYLDAIIALARVRKLQVPDIHVGPVNIGGQQFNIQESAHATETDPQEFDTTGADATHSR